MEQVKRRQYLLKKSNLLRKVPKFWRKADPKKRKIGAKAQGMETAVLSVHPSIDENVNFDGGDEAEEEIDLEALSSKLGEIWK